MTIKTLIRKGCSFIARKILPKRQYYCGYIQRKTVNFYPDDKITPCCYSLVLEIARIRDFDNDFTSLKEKIENENSLIREQFKKGKAPDACKGCPCLHRIYKTPETSDRIKMVIFNHYMACNLNCSYCGSAKNVRGKQKDTKHEDVLSILQYLINSESLDPQCTFVFGGGEPSISKGAISIIQFALEHGYHVHINSNCAKYIDFWAVSADKGLASLVLTPDAGSKEVYRKIKGADYFDIVWETIKKYNIRTTKNVVVKFILQYDNLPDVVNIVNKCVECNVREVIIDFDIGVKEFDPSLFVEPLKQLRKMFIKNGIIVGGGGICQQFCGERQGCRF